MYCLAPDCEQCKGFTIQNNFVILVVRTLAASRAGRQLVTAPMICLRRGKGKEEEKKEKMEIKEVR